MFYYFKRNMVFPSELWSNYIYVEEPCLLFFSIIPYIPYFFRFYDWDFKILVGIYLKQKDFHLVLWIFTVVLDSFGIPVRSWFSNLYIRKPFIMWKIQIDPRLKLPFQIHDGQWTNS